MASYQDLSDQGMTVNITQDNFSQKLLPTAVSRQNCQGSDGHKIGTNSNEAEISGFHIQ